MLIDFGSVGCMGLLGSPSRLMKVLVSALSMAGLRAVLLTGMPPHHCALVTFALSQHEQFHGAMIDVKQQLWRTKLRQITSSSA